MISENKVLLKVKNLKKYFPVTSGIVFQKEVGAVKAVDDISFEVFKGETLGLVGESGCGKSTTGRTILQLYRPTSGEVFFEGTNLVKLKEDALRKIRRRAQMIFQDPYSSLNPRTTVDQIISEPLQIHKIATGKECVQRVKDLLNKVGLNPKYGNRYPHEFSGGQRQRIAIARALALNPEFIVCDEPISALDVSIQAQIVNLLEQLQDELGLTYLFIAHDLSVVEHISDKIAVMYLGNLMEFGAASQVYHHPKHPYSQALLSAVPVPDPKQKNRNRIILKGDVPTPMNIPSGCSFRTRCPIAVASCSEEVPKFELYAPNHWVACPIVKNN